MNSFHYSAEAPEDYRFGVNPDKCTVKVNITGRDFSDIYPAGTFEDASMKLAFDGQRFAIVNKTQQYMEVKSISVYYGDRTFTRDYDEVGLPPGAHRDSYSISDYVDTGIKAMARYPNMTATIAGKPSSILALRSNTGWARMPTKPCTRSGTSTCWRS